MISYLEGILCEANFTNVVIDVGGIGYFVSVPLLVSEKLPLIGGKIKLYTHAVYREDAHTLYGFLTREERDFFNMIISHVSGVGPKTALNIMSRMSLDVLMQAIADRNITLLSKCQGLGKKTAEKLILELSDKVVGKSAIKKHSVENLCICSSNSSISDAVSALVSLGYRTNDADRAVQKAVEKIGGDASTEELLKFALKA